ncbi:MAG: hypothetical protein AAGF94_14295 [Pseudomonadota bacterium]
MALPTEAVETVEFEAIKHAGGPSPTFLNPLDDARFWASYASRAELKAYCLASFEVMRSEDQAGFIGQISPMEAAA